jgi:hypothetical protein
VIEIANLTWFWHKCFVIDSDGEKYYLCAMGEYQMMIRESWDEHFVNIKWKPMIAKWNDDRQIFDELLAADVSVSLDVRDDLKETQAYLQKWYITYVLADKLILGETDANVYDFKLGGDPERM